MNYSIDIMKTILVRESILELDAVNDKAAAVEALLQFGMAEYTEEHVVLLCLNAKGVPIGIHTVSIGDLSSSIISPRAIFSRAILNNAAGIILAHNHPSGDITPSSEDIQVTLRIQDAGAILGIRLIDHIIIGCGGSHLSFMESGLL